MSGFLSEILSSNCISEPQRILRVLFLWQILICVYTICLLSRIGYPFYSDYNTPGEFFTPADDFLLESVWRQVSSSIQNSFQYSAHHNNSVIWMVSIRYLISNSSSPLFKPLGTFPSSPIISAITVTYMFHHFLSSLIGFPLFGLLEQ